MHVHEAAPSPCHRVLMRTTAAAQNRCIQLHRGRYGLNKGLYKPPIDCNHYQSVSSTLCTVTVVALYIGLQIQTRLDKQRLAELPSIPPPITTHQLRRLFAFLKCYRSQTMQSRAFCLLSNIRRLNDSRILTACSRQRYLAP